MDNAELAEAIDQARFQIINPDNGVDVKNTFKVQLLELLGIQLDRAKNGVG